VNDGVRLLRRAALGAVGGLAGTLALQALMGAGRRWMPETLPPMHEEPRRFMVREAEQMLPDSVQDWIPESAEKVASATLGMGYGLTFGALYGLIRPRGGNALTDGLALGAACWATGYLGWLPALGLMPPVWRQSVPQAIAPAAEHLVYGVTAVAAYDWLRRAFGAEDREPVEALRRGASLTSAAL